MKPLAPFILLLLNSITCYAGNLATFEKELAELGLREAAFAAVAVPDARPYPATPRSLQLELEALADPDKFIDERTPEEVAQAFGLPGPSRFLVTDQARIDRAALRLTVDLSRQRLMVVSSGPAREFKISSGLPPSHATPGSGRCYAPDFMEEMHYSSLYNKAPMPNSIFFNGNIAMHGTNAEAMLGRPASHGCVRLSKADAKTVYGMVKAVGKANAIICVRGVTPRP